MKSHTKPAPGEDPHKKEVDVEQQLSWQSGSALMKTQAADSHCQRDFLRSDLAVAFSFKIREAR